MSGKSYHKLIRTVNAFGEDGRPMGTIGDKGSFSLNVMT